MALRFDATATGKLNGVEYRVKIFDSRFTGSATRLIDTGNFVTVNLGEGDGDGSGVFKPREIEVTLATPVDLSVITDAAEDDIRVELVRQDTGQLVYKGFIAPNQYSDQPLFERDIDAVRLTGSEGLGLLEKQDASVLPSGSRGTVTLDDALMTILNQLYPNSLGAQLAINWFPAGSSGGIPFANEISIDAFREERPNGDFVDLRQALKDLLRPFNLTIQQTVRPFGPTITNPANRPDELIWWVSQWGAYGSDGSIKVFELPPDLFPIADRNENLLLDLGDVGQDATIQPRHERTFERQRSSVEVTYDHPAVKNYVSDGGLENGEWTTIGPSPSFIANHKNLPPTPPPTTNNEKVGVINLDSQDPDYGRVVFGLRYEGRLTKAATDAALRFAMQTVASKGEVIQPLVKLRVGNTFFSASSTKITVDAPANEERLSVEELPFPIPQGARLPIEETADLSDERNHKGFMTLRERAEPGDSVLVGDLSTSTSIGDQLIFIQPTSGETFLELGAFRPYGALNRYGGVSFVAPFQDVNGNEPAGNTFRIDLGVQLDFIRGNVFEINFDNVVLKPLKEGTELSRTVSTAGDGTVGESEEFDTRIGSGPAEGISSAIIGGLQWGSGEPPNSNTFQLSELFARERLRYFRGQTKRLRVRTVRDNPLLGHELVRLNGEEFRVVATEVTRTDGEYAVTLLQHKDFGTQ